MADTTETQAADSQAADDGGSPFAAMDPEMAANPQPVFKALRESMPVMRIEDGGTAWCCRARPRSTRPSATPRSSPPTWTRSTCRTTGR